MAYRRCPVCFQYNGKPCVAQSGRVVDGRPDGKRVNLLVPHAGRRLRSVRKGKLPRVA
jgi:hypothetical protein